MLKQGSPSSFGNTAVILWIAVLCESIVHNLQSKTKIQFLSSPTYIFVLLEELSELAVGFWGFQI